MIPITYSFWRALSSGIQRRVVRWVACQVFSWPEISDYIKSRREMEEWTSVPIGSLGDRMKLLASHMTTKRTNRRQAYEFWWPWKGGSFAGLGKSVRVCWAGNWHVKWVAGMRWGTRERAGSRRKPGHQSGGWWVPREGIFCALIRVVCTDRHDPAENPHLLSCDGRFLWPCQGHQNSCSCLLLVRSVVMWEPSGFNLSLSEVHSSISLLLPM
jgi:hypothetical protein